MKTLNISKMVAGLLAFAFVMLSVVTQSYATASLSASTAYTVELYKMNSDGTTTLVDTASATSDANSKITFSFTSVPTQDTNNFLIINVKDAAGAVVTKSFSPAPATGKTNSLGVNTTSTSQAKLMEKLGAIIGTDDPIVVSFALMFTRTPGMSDSDIANFAIVGDEAIIKGMEVYMLANGATTAQLATFKKKLVYNSTTGAKDLRSFSALFKSAIDTTGTSDDDMAKASGLISDIFVDAAKDADIDLDLVLSAFDSAGIKLESGAGLTAMNALSGNFKTNMNQSVRGFFTRLSAVKVKGRYNAALTALNATTAEKTRFTTGVDAMMTAMAAIDTTYAQYFDGTTPITSAIQTAMNNAYTTAFTNFKTAIASTDAERTAMVSSVSTATGATVASLNAINLGTYRDFGGTTLNWPIPQTVSVEFIAAAITAGGGLTYTRDTLTVPSMMSWLNGTGTRSTFNTGSTSFDALLGIQEDLMIVENTRYSIFGSGQPTQAQMQTAKKAFMTNMGTIVGNIGGTTDGSTAFTALQKKFIVKAQQQPSLN